MANICYFSFSSLYKWVLCCNDDRRTGGHFWRSKRSRVRNIFLLLRLGAGLILAAGSGQGASAEPAIPSVSANQFLSSLGVITHVDQGVSGGSYILPLRYLGVRNIRDGNRNSSQIELIHRETGVRLDLFFEGYLPETLAIGKKLAASGAIMAFEGPNEPNNFPITYNGQTGGSNGSWSPIAQFQEALYRAVKSDSDLKGYPVFAVSESGAETDNVGLQFLTIPANAGATFPEGTHFADYANTHNYVSSTHPRYVNNQAWNAADPILNGPWDGMFGDYGVTWRNHFKGYSNEELSTLPRVTTETGWDTVIDYGGERIQGTILVNTYLAQFKRGWRYTFIYQLRDGEGGEGNQGIFKSNSTPKLAATYIHNLTTIMADDTPIASPGSLNYRVLDEPDTVHDLLIQKSNGVFELAIWGEKTVGVDKVTVDLGGKHAKVNVYDVTIGTNPIQALANADSVSLLLSDHAMIVEIAN
jgi:hypothetical protein